MINWNEIDWRKVGKSAGIALLALFVFYLLMDNIVMPLYTRHGQAVTVPNLANLVYEDAREALDRLDLKIVEEAKKYDTSNEFPIGTIMAQNPRPGTTVKTGRRIYVVVSKGEPLVEMPKLVGESERNAIFILENMGLALGEIYYEPSDSSNHLLIGKVIQQSIPIGREVKIGTTVHITVISASDLQFVPNVVGLTLAEAKKTIIQAGLLVGEIYYEEKADLLPETVIDQLPGADEKVSSGVTVSLWISKLPDGN